MIPGSLRQRSARSTKCGASRSSTRAIGPTASSRASTRRQDVTRRSRSTTKLRPCSTSQACCMKPATVCSTSPPACCAAPGTSAPRACPIRLRWHALLPLIGWQQVHWHAHHIRLPRAGMELDFGGFGKEYAADRAAEVLRAAGVQHGFVNLGGDIRVVGPRADGQPWRFGIQHPRQGEGHTIASVEMSTGALATSGDYERFFEHEGRRYCHILDPRTGWPVGCGHPASCVPPRQAGGRAASCGQAAASWASISVTAPACTAAGALSTIAMLKGEQRARVPGHAGRHLPRCRCRAAPLSAGPASEPAI